MKTPFEPEFAGASRAHVGLSVRGIERSRAFYEAMFGVPPTKVRPGYVKFEVVEPSLNLSLNEVTESAEPQHPSGVTSAAHYGVQLRNAGAVRDAAQRLADAGLETRLEVESTCCYAVQDKVWVTDPDGHPWEFFAVTEPDADERKAQDSACCSSQPSGSASEPSPSACCG